MTSGQSQGLNLVSTRRVKFLLCSDDVPLKSLTFSTLINAESGNQPSGNTADNDENQSDTGNQSQASQSQPLLFLSSSDEESDKENGKV